MIGTEVVRSSYLDTVVPVIHRADVQSEGTDKPLTSRRHQPWWPISDQVTGALKLASQHASWSMRKEREKRTVSAPILKN
jgi:hypothetical protein